MNPMPELGKVLVVIGLVCAGIGLLLMVGPRIPFLGHLPGDIVIRKGNFVFYFPLATCILVSLALTLLFSLFRR